MAALSKNPMDPIPILRRAVPRPSRNGSESDQLRLPRNAGQRAVTRPQGRSSLRKVATLSRPELTSHALLYISSLTPTWTRMNNRLLGHRQTDVESEGNRVASGRGTIEGVNPGPTPGMRRCVGTWGGWRLPYRGVRGFGSSRRSASTGAFDPRVLKDFRHTQIGRPDSSWV